MTEAEARREILEKVREYYHCFHDGKRWDGKRVSYGGRVYDEREMENLTEAMLDFGLTAGRFAIAFERNFAAYIGVKHCALVNSGSSANLLAFHTLTSPLLGEKRICRGDEVITVAAGFPTTVAPILQYGAVPVFVDVTLPQYNIDVSMLEEALSPKTKAVMIAHTLGNPFDVKAVVDFCQKHDLWLVEDNCDAVGAAYCLDGNWRKTGTFGHLSTVSFYPPHHMTMGEGGAVCTNDDLLGKIMVSLRDWGRDCTCAPRYHFDYLLTLLEKSGEKVILPEVAENAMASPFGFLLTCREGISRENIVSQLEEKGIQTRPLFAGNLLRHPCFDTLEEGVDYRVIGELPVTDRILRDTFWVGVYPGLTAEQLAYEGEVLYDVIRKA